MKTEDPHIQTVHDIHTADQRFNCISGKYSDDKHETQVEKKGLSARLQRVVPYHDLTPKSFAIKNELI
ncbi:hypothetical protein D3C73_1260240 [compost metagenome]